MLGRVGLLRWVVEMGGGARRRVRRRPCWSDEESFRFRKTLIWCCWVFFENSPAWPASRRCASASARHDARATFWTQAGILSLSHELHFFPFPFPHVKLDSKDIVLARANFSNMDDDDDAPPMLVAADGTAPDDVEGRLSAEMTDVKITKVPITIITGSSRRFP